MNAETENKDQQEFNVIVAVQQNNILATAFHPELTDDLRWHRYTAFHLYLVLTLIISNRAFLKMVLDHKKQYQI
jgi:hypothetical protein